jgi:hypothetical protein
MSTIDPIGMAGGTIAVLVASVIAWFAMTEAEIPVFGGARTALVAVALIGVVGCAVGGVGNAPALGWTNPMVLIGTALGILAGVVILSGLIGWEMVLDPIGRVAPIRELVAPSAERLAIVGVVAIMVVKWLITLALFARQVVLG